MNTTTTTTGLPEWKQRLDREIEKDSKNKIYSVATIESPDKPRTRSIVHRSFLSSDILQATTDVRSPKSFQIHNGSKAEILWWFPESQVQFRLQSLTFLLPSKSHEWRKDFPTDLLESQVDWEANRVECFNALGSFLRASFVRPPPGSELDHPEESKNWPKHLPKLGDEEDQELVKSAFENYAILYFKVVEVDLVDLGVIPNERVQYTFQSGEWSRKVLVP